MGLREWRFCAGLSQRELALKSRVSRQTIGKLEAGQRPPSPVVAHRLSHALSAELGLKVESWNLFPQLYYSPQELLAAQAEEQQWL